MNLFILVFCTDEPNRLNTVIWLLISLENLSLTYAKKILQIIKNTYKAFIQFHLPIVCLEKIIQIFL